MASNVTLREVIASDLNIFFQQQADPAPWSERLTQAR
jgi:hypothetical protein